MTKRPWLRDLAAVALLAVATLGFFWRVVTGQNFMPADGGDLVSFLFPTYRFAASSLQAGAWPLWNPFLYGGAPHVGDIQSGFLYLPHLLLFLIKPDFPYTALQWLSMVHVWFAGAGMLLFLVHGFGLRRVAAIAGAVAFMFADPFLTHFGNLNLNAAASWLPWVFWAWTACLRDSNRLTWRSLVCGGVLALAISAGHIQATLFTLLALATYTAFWLWLHREEAAPVRRAGAALLNLTLVVVVAALLAAPILLPAFELTARTARADWNYAATAGYSLSPAQWIGWLIPGFFGRGPQFHWGAWPRVEVGYAGILTLVLAALAFAGRRGWGDERRLWTLAGLAVVSVVLALGIYAVPHGWLTLLPGFGQLRAPARFVWITDFAIAALAAFGLHNSLGMLAGAARGSLDAAWRRLSRVTAAVWVVAVPLTYSTLLLMQDRDNSIVIRTSITLLAVVTFAGLLLVSLFWLWLARAERARPATLGWLAVLVIFLDLASLGAYQDLGDRDPSQSFEHPAIVSFLASEPGTFRIDSRTQIEGQWQPNTALLYGLQDVTGVANPLVLADFETYWGGLGSRSTPLYDLLNVRYVIAAKDVELDWTKFGMAFDGDPQLNVYENRNALPRAYFVSSAQTVASHEESLAAIRAEGFDPLKSAVVEAPAAIPTASSDGGAVTDIVFERNSFAFRTSAQESGLVFVSQVWYPGWRVYVDGQAAGVPQRVNFLFQGLVAPAGDHQIELRFEPASWRFGWWIAGLAAIAVLIGFVLAWRGRKRYGD